MTTAQFRGKGASLQGMKHHLHAEDFISTATGNISED